MISISNLYIQYGDRILFDSISTTINIGEKIGLTGRNGAGKSTLLKILAGEITQFDGVVDRPRNETVAYLHQDIEISGEHSVIEEAMKAFEELNEIERQIQIAEHDLTIRDDYESDSYAKLIDNLTHLTEQFEYRGGNQKEANAEKILKGLGFKSHEFSKKVKELSGGWQMRVELAKMLLTKPDYLLLDEPTNHLDLPSIQWLEKYLQDYDGTFILVSHDRYFLDNVAGWILELDRGEGIPWKGNYSSWLDQKSKRLEQEEKVASKRRKTLERELEWVRQGAKGRQTKQKARLQNYDKLLNEDQKELDEKLEIYIPNGPRLGTNVIEAKGVAKAFGDKLLYDNLNFTLPQAGIVGIIGPNGAGKSTILRMIMGEEKPDAGEFTIGDTVKIAYVDQSHSNIDPNKSIWENFCDGQELIMMGGRQVNSRAYLSRFNFGGSDQNKKVSALSGGERNRLHLAMTLKEEGNVLLLDEPTNDLDVNTLRALEEGLENFAGCAVVISHDRWFLDRICTHILAFEGNSEVYYFEGGFSEYEENKKKRLGADATPKRIKYRKLIRN